MATTSNLSSIIRYYAEKTKSPFIDFKEFCSYIKKYAERHVEEQGELVKYLGNPISTVTAEIQGLTEKKLVALIDANNKKLIVSIPFFSVQFVNQYKKILDNNTLFFPLLTDLPKQFPNTLLERKEASFYIPSIIDKEETNSPLLYVLNFSDDIPAMLLPAAIPLHILLKVSQQKVKIGRAHV